MDVARHSNATLVAITYSIDAGAPVVVPDHAVNLSIKTINTSVSLTNAGVGATKPTDMQSVAGVGPCGAIILSATGEERDPQAVVLGLSTRVALIRLVLFCLFIF